MLLTEQSLQRALQRIPPIQSKIIAETPGAIGYLAFSYINDDKVTPLSIGGIKPEEKTSSQASIRFGLTSTLIRKVKRQVYKTFLDYMNSDEVQKSIVKDQGYIPISDMKVTRDANGKQS